ncbi:TPA: hypothetical protein N0F65_011582 [Lagenidium giganteum]|uniref:Nucleotide-diphospho-sugar transferase domain-containing protein n=1 Tax=Lagenidium giganteum TaxID=4803 RepID=A0AAV2YJK7_9STRA|nr:TPA: hypothetical protein N0F65_011582 [Lagenidium giganteum]
MARLVDRPIAIILVLITALLIIANSVKMGRSITASLRARPDVWSAPYEVFETRDRLPATQLKQPEAASKKSLEQGIVLPLFDKIAVLGASLILELRALHVDLPIEVPHCGDLAPEMQQRLMKIDSRLRIYDVCALAAHQTDPLAPQSQWFCRDLKHCQERFRSFYIKVLSVVLSRFQEVMLVDADVMFFRSPMALWQSMQYATTGTFFFHDRICYDTDFLGERIDANNDRYRAMHAFLSTFNLDPFRGIPTLPRPRARTDVAGGSLNISEPFEPSEFLLQSHSWNSRSGHQMDSSLLLWNKERQPRATAILAHFISLCGSYPPSHGDKEFFFLASELAETQYGFSDYNVGSLGWEVNANRTQLCGDMVQYSPSNAGNASAARLLYINSKHFLDDVRNKHLMRTLARPASVYPGSHKKRGLRHICTFDAPIVPLTKDDVMMGYGWSVPHEAAEARVHSHVTYAHRRDEAANDQRFGRGIVLPLFDKIAVLGASLILELRALHVDLPIEVPHCGDLAPEMQQRLMKIDSRLRIYDVCALAAHQTDPLAPQSQWFCRDLKHCQERFRSFYIKVLSVVLSRFQEVMLVDADVMFFRSPMALWQSMQYATTGTFFFHDRICYDTDFLGERIDANNDRYRAMHAFLSTFDVKPFRNIPTLPRPPATAIQANDSLNISLAFEPSEFLLQSHSWNGRTGHQMESSLLLWNKKQQPRATAVLAHFISLQGRMPPLYGDKELFFLACELAETRYGFSDYNVGSLGWEVNADRTQLCGDMLEYLPSNASDASAAEPLHINGKHFLDDVRDKQLMRTLARPASVYPGSHKKRGLPHMCTFDTTVTPLTKAELAAFERRKDFYRDAERSQSKDARQNPTIATD